jgi:hypothetical protein
VRRGGRPRRLCQECQQGLVIGIKVGIRDDQPQRGDLTRSSASGEAAGRSDKDRRLAPVGRVGGRVGAANCLQGLPRGVAILRCRPGALRGRPDLLTFGQLAFGRLPHRAFCRSVCVAARSRAIARRFLASARAFAGRFAGLSEPFLLVVGVGCLLTERPSRRRG